ncbi:MAG: hypothetical protein ACJASB_002723 [Shewanella psychromarinicola]|jgi:hypothetical protein
MFNTIATSITQAYRVRIMAVFALIIAALQENYQSTAGPIDT